MLVKVKVLKDLDVYIETDNILYFHGRTNTHGEKSTTIAFAGGSELVVATAPQELAKIIKPKKAGDSGDNGGWTSLPVEDGMGAV